MSSAAEIRILVTAVIVQLCSGSAHAQEPLPFRTGLFSTLQISEGTSAVSFLPRGDSFRQTFWR